jgi:hypothetical protein
MLDFDIRIIEDMPSRNDTPNAALYAQIQQRMVESGEWDR